MKVGITGARGFLGTAIIAEAKSRHWKVVAYSRSENTVIEGADEVRSFANTESLDVSGLDALVHLAGEPIVGLWTKEKLRRVRDSRVDLTTDLIEALARTPEEDRPKVLVSASGIGFYGNRADEVLDEGAEVGLGFIPELCREWEAAAYEAKRHGIRVVVPRIGLVLGDQGLLQKVRPIFKLGIGGKLGAGSQWMSWIHINDIAGIFMECIQQCGLHGEVNAAAPNPVRNSEFTKIYARVLRRLAVIPVPQFILKHLPGGMGCLFLDSQRIEPAVMNAFSYQWRFPDLERALRDIEGRELPEDKVDCEDVADS
ncbi:MAG: TIGR01777 family protein [Verrucomicrobiales bacterium]|jgi:uncharacterized protein (TIGR01777 family)|nr:TIGR01777 family protein [Verrucomicrobiales bacterium]|tara:strand:- start:11546 stop:12484 length:939 start_codon:yes stop_codon:yes gene_type:complete